MQLEMPFNSICALIQDCGQLSFRVWVRNSDWSCNNLSIERKLIVFCFYNRLLKLFFKLKCQKFACSSFLNERICCFFVVHDRKWVFWLLVGQKKRFEDAMFGLWENVMSIFHLLMTLISVEGRNLPFSWPQPSDLVTQPEPNCI